MKFLIVTPILGLLCIPTSLSFVSPVPKTVQKSLVSPRHAIVESASVIENDTVIEDDLEKRRELLRQKQKQALLGLLKSDSVSGSANVAFDPIFVDPLTKEPLFVSIKGTILGGRTPSSSGLRLQLRSKIDSPRVFEGRTDAYINLLEPVSTSSGTENDPLLGGGDTTEYDSESKSAKRSVSSSPILSSLLTVVPPPLRSTLANLGEIEYIPMRDLFTSPSVSFAYERGWRQGFTAAGYPGVEKEFQMAMEYFAPVMEKRKKEGRGGVLVDMSCATGLFTRRFAKSNEYSRVLGCDYSDSMLTEARRRIRADPDLGNFSAPNSNGASQTTRLDLVRLDVANIPFQSSSIDVLHAGAAMHCWPEIESSLKEIHRVLVPGGRYFATTFLGNYFTVVSNAEKAANGGQEMETSMKAFQYFPSAEYLKNLLIEAGFEEEKVNVEAVGRSCAIIRCEK